MKRVCAFFLIISVPSLLMSKEISTSIASLLFMILSFVIIIAGIRGRVVEEPAVRRLRKQHLEEISKVEKKYEQDLIAYQSKLDDHNSIKALFFRSPRERARQAFRF